MLAGAVPAGPAVDAWSTRWVGIPRSPISTAVALPRPLAPTTRAARTGSPDARGGTRSGETSALATAMATMVMAS